MSRTIFHGFQEEHSRFLDIGRGKAAALAGPLDAIPVYRPQLPTADRILPYLRQIDANRHYTNHGPLASELESRLSDHFSLPLGGVACASSGTTALFCAIIAAAGLASESRPWALVPGLTFSATAAAVEQAGYRPYLVDVDPDTWILDPDRIADHPMLDRVGLIVPVAPFGRPVPVRPWEDFRSRTQVPVVIDAAASFQNIAEAPGAYLGGLPVCISFHATKSFGVGEGGCVAATDPDLIVKVMQALNFGFMDRRESSSPGTNGKMSEYHAAVGLAELEGWSDKRQAFHTVAETYRHMLASRGHSGRFFGAPDIGCNYAIFSCRTADEVGAVHESLRRGSVDFRHWYGAGLQGQSYFARCRQDRLDVTEALASTLVGVPMAPDLAPSAVARVCNAVAEGVDRSLSE
jgi:dTDP-4-amino-4,6-dideoxygalactose transaminase